LTITIAHTARAALRPINKIKGKIMAITQGTYAKEDPARPSIESDVNAQPSRRRGVNLSEGERGLSALGGAALAIYGLSKGGGTGLILGLAGGGLLYRGLTGHCYIYEALDINTARRRGSRASVAHGQGIKTEKSVTINKPAHELYRFWRKLDNLPQFMQHLDSVRTIDDRRSHWVAKAPMATTVEWDAEIINEKENELIAWRSLENSEIPNAGSVRFEEAPSGRGTIVKVAINYDPPAGKLGTILAQLFGEEPGQQVEEDLRRFKQMMEAGEMASVEGQPSGRRAARTKSDHTTLEHVSVARP
jgi:uncharacterized membrane protein